MKILVLDNFDSFTYNLVHLLESLNVTDYKVSRNNEISLSDVNHFDKIILSPGPGIPKDAGIMPELIKEYSDSKSIFGVCLGMQGIVESFGGKLCNLTEPLHGVGTKIYILSETEKLFLGIQSPLSGGHYHSWVADKESLPDCLTVTAEDENGNVMAVRHSSLDVCGVQFHPESIMTQYGKEIIGNWLRK